MSYLAFVCQYLLSHVLMTAVVGQDIFFYDWDHMQTCTPLTYSQPQSEEDIISAILTAKALNETLKVIGTGHSFSGIQLTEGHMVSLDRYNDFLGRTDLPDGSALVEVQAGIRLRDFNAGLEERGVSLLNLGATAAQSVAGATATGTHGTGTQLGSISTQISALRLVDSTGSVHLVSEQDTDTDLFEAARVGLGAVGAISTMTFKAVPLFKLRKRLIEYELPTLLKVSSACILTHFSVQTVCKSLTFGVVLIEIPLLEIPLLMCRNCLSCWSNMSDCNGISHLTPTRPHWCYVKKSP